MGSLTLRKIIPSDIGRFMAKVSKDESGCWIWTGAMRKSGYGAFGFGRATDYAHRASFRLFVGEIGEGLYVCHKCDNPKCVNPDHLFVGTAKDNMRDASEKGRVRLPKKEQMLRAENQPMSKLKNFQVLEIRSSTETNIALAKRYGVSDATISLARRGIKYGSVK